MTVTDLPLLLSPVDIAGVVLLLLLWVGLGPIIENTRAKRPSVAVLMSAYRREWMRHAVTRDPRVYDAMMITSLRQNTSFSTRATCSNRKDR